MTLYTENWPEEEAGITFASYEACIIDEGITYANEWLQRQVAHMTAVFDDDADTARYTAQLQSLINPVWQQ